MEKNFTKWRRRIFSPNSDFLTIIQMKFSRLLESSLSQIKKETKPKFKQPKTSVKKPF